MSSKAGNALIWLIIVGTTLFVGVKALVSPLWLLAGRFSSSAYDIRIAVDYNKEQRTSSQDQYEGKRWGRNFLSTVSDGSYSQARH